MSLPLPKYRHHYIFIGLTLGTLFVGYMYFTQTKKSYDAVSSFDECVKAGYPLLEIYPEICKMPGKQFINPKQQIQATLPLNTPTTNDINNLTYLVDGTSVVFSGGRGTLLPNRLIKKGTTTLEIFGNPFLVDLNRDTSLDTVMLMREISPVTSEPLGAYYLTASLSLNTGYLGINALYVGSNLATTTFFYKDNILTLEYILMKATNKQYKQFTLENAILKEQK